MESKRIALALEPLFPERSAHLDSAVLTSVEEAWLPVMKAFFPIMFPKMPRECLSGPSIEYYLEARKKTFGITLDDLEAKYGGERAWQKAEPRLKKVAEISKEDPSGPYCLGETPSYADFLIVGILEWCKNVEGGVFQRIFGIDKAFLELHDACKPWLERNDR